MSAELPIVDCADCGACCMNVGHPHFYRHGGADGSGDPLWARVPTELQAEINEYIDSLEDVDIGQPCIWLDMKTKQCKHYDLRPQMCRDFEKDSHHCHRLREKYAAHLSG